MDFESLRRLMMADRTVRRFHEDREVSVETLEKIVELTRYCHSGRNAQPLKYVLVTDAEEREKVYPLLKWAGYFNDWDGPERENVLQPTSSSVLTRNTARSAYAMMASSWRPSHWACIPSDSEDAS